MKPATSFNWRIVSGSPQEQERVGGRGVMGIFVHVSTPCLFHPRVKLTILLWGCFLYSAHPSLSSDTPAPSLRPWEFGALLFKVCCPSGRPRPCCSAAVVLLHTSPWASQLLSSFLGTKTYKPAPVWKTASLSPSKLQSAVLSPQAVCSWDVLVRVASLCLSTALHCDIFIIWCLC